MKDELAKNICRYRKEKGYTQEDCNSSGIPHKHAMNKIIAQKQGVLK